jgi:hypothetical protein
MTPRSNPTLISEIAALLTDRVQQHYGPGSRVEDLRRTLVALTGDDRPSLPAALADLETATQTASRHLELAYPPQIKKSKSVNDELLRRGLAPHAPALGSRLVGAVSDRIRSGFCGLNECRCVGVLRW